MTRPIAEHDYVVLTRDLPECGLLAGDIGVVVHIHRQPGDDLPTGYMIELFSVSGESLDEVSVRVDAVRAASRKDRPHVRPIAAE